LWLPLALLLYSKQSSVPAVWSFNQAEASHTPTHVRYPSKRSLSHMKQTEDGGAVSHAACIPSLVVLNVGAT
jgi:hypothetical protein